MDIIVYTTPTCPYCHLLKDFLDGKKIKYKEVDLSIDQKAAEEVIQKSGLMGAPITEINGKFIAGFDQEKIEKELLLNKTDIRTNDI